MTLFASTIAVLIAMTAWTTTAGTHTITLAHGTRQTDDRDFRADCAPDGSGRITVALAQTVPGLAANAPLEVRVSTGKQIVRYAARGRMDDGTATVMPVFAIEPGDRLLQWLARGAEIRVRAGGGMDYHVTGSGSAPAVARFIAACDTKRAPAL